jgi:hypothetical protein
MSCCFDFFFPRLWVEPPSLARNSVVAESRDPMSLPLAVRRPCLFFARFPGGRATFLCVAKERWPKERPPRCCVFRPSMDEKCVRTGRACRRAIHGASASGRNPLRPPFGPSRPALTAAQGPQLRFHDGHRGLVRSEIKQFASSSQHTGCASNGAPRTRRADDGSVRRMARRMRASSPQAQGCAFGEPRRPLAHPEHTDVLRTCSRGGFSLGDFSLAKQREVTRAPGRGAEKDRDVVAPRCARQKDRDVEALECKRTMRKVVLS